MKEPNLQHKDQTFIKHINVILENKMTKNNLYYFPSSGGDLKYEGD